MESWKKNVTEVGLQDVGPGSYSVTQMPGEDAVPAEWLVDVLQEIVPFANIFDIQPSYEKLKGVLGKPGSSPDEITMASIAFLYAVGSVLIDGHPVAKMAKAGRKAAEVGFELAPKIVSAVKKIEKAPFELAPKVRKQAKNLPFELKSKAAKQGKNLPFVLKPKGFARFDLSPKE